ncbi:MAG: GTP 3',8-cyclase MoaA [Acidobacteria bacterium]|nr:MAG: GTP 3',8-cyclase MoaA [Acidobacteriota bacterium]
MIRDQLGRELYDLRISITDRCNFRCFFCMPDGHEYQFFPREELLTFEEIERFVKALVPLGVRKVRLTGGEPLLRKNIEKLVELLSNIEGVEDISLTTNGFLLQKRAKSLKEAGLKRITVSLHSLRDDVLSELVGREVKVWDIIRGIERALEVGMNPVKVNVCVIRGVNSDEVVDIAKFFKSLGVVVRFIEFMDVGNLNQWSLEKVFPAKDMLELLSRHFELEPIEKSYRGEVAERYKYRDDRLEVGFISSITQPFCGDCTRLRLTADGKLLMCLFASEGYDVRALIRSGADERAIGDFVKSLWLKRKDRYSEERLQLLRMGIPLRKVEMFKVGG